jgi:hypothetical protein
MSIEDVGKRSMTTKAEPLVGAVRLAQVFTCYGDADGTGVFTYSAFKQACLDEFDETPSEKKVMKSLNALTKRSLIRRIEETRWKAIKHRT